MQAHSRTLFRDKVRTPKSAMTVQTEGCPPEKAGLKEENRTGHGKRCPLICGLLSAYSGVAATRLYAAFGVFMVNVGSHNRRCRVV